MVGEEGLEPSPIATLDPKLPMGNQALPVAAHPCGRRICPACLWSCIIGHHWLCCV